MIAYAGLAGLPPQTGLYTLLVTLAAYAIFGTSRHVVAARRSGLLETIGADSVFLTIDESVAALGQAPRA